jgi:hypothetical protein
MDFLKTVMACLTAACLGAVGGCAADTAPVTRASAIPVATATPAPTPSPVPRLKSADVVAAFRKSGLGVGKSFAITRRQIGPAPFVTDDMARFLIPSLGADNGGRVFVCATAEKAAKLKAYYDGLGEASAAFYSHCFRNGPAVVQINGDLPDDKAKEFERTLMRMRFYEQGDAR